MRWPYTRVIKAVPLRWSLGPCWSLSSLIPRPPPCTRWSLLLWPRRRSKHLHLTPVRCHISVQKIGSPAYRTKIVYKNTWYNHGASNAPPAAPPSGGGGGPTPPAPGGGGGTSAGPSCPGGRRPLVIAASTPARRMIDRHGGGNPTHYSRNSSSWIRVHMPSGTSRKTVSN